MEPVRATRHKGCCSLRSFARADQEPAAGSVANMLYLESPAGCDDPIGFSYCTKGGKIQKTCQWDDKTQAEAYAHTLAAFLEAFPE